MPPAFKMLASLMLAGVVGIPVGAQSVPAACPKPDTAGLLIDFLDVGQGDAALIRTSDGRRLLIDGGPSSARLLRFPKVTSAPIDLLIISHNHLDHLGGLVEVPRKVRVLNAIDNGMPATIGSYLTLLQRFRESGTRLLNASRRDLTLGTATISILPPKTGATDQNTASVGAVIGFGRFRVLFTGDADRKALGAWFASGLLQPVSVLKVPHHGSSTGITETLVRSTRPRLAVISLGTGNRYGHPDPEVLRRWGEVGTTILRTDRAGTISVRGCLDGRMLVSTERPSRSGKSAARP